MLVGGEQVGSTQAQTGTRPVPHQTGTSNMDSPSQCHYNPSGRGSPEQSTEFNIANVRHLSIPRSIHSNSQVGAPDWMTPLEYHGKFLSPVLSTADDESDPDREEWFSGLATPSTPAQSPSVQRLSIDPTLEAVPFDQFGDKDESSFSIEDFEDLKLPSTKTPTDPFGADPILQLGDLYQIEPILDSATNVVEANLAFFDVPPHSHLMGVDGFQTTQTSAERYQTTPPPSFEENFWLVIAQADVLKQRVRSVARINPLAAQLDAMTSFEIYNVGLTTSARMTGGSLTEPPLSVICMMLLSFTMGHMVYGLNTERQSRELFVQTIEYTTRFAPSERQGYVDIVDILWRPQRWTRADVDGLVRQCTQETDASPGVGRPRNTHGPHARGKDPHVFVHAYMTDGFEYMVMKSRNEPMFQHSALTAQHLHDMALDFHREPPFVMATVLLLKMLAQLVSDVPAFTERLVQMIAQVERRQCTVTARRLELQLLHMGRVHLEVERFFDHYLPVVRTHVDILYAHSSDSSTERNLYRVNSVEMCRSILPGDSSHRPAMPLDGSPFQDDLSGALGSGDGFQSGLAATTPSFGDETISAAYAQSPSATFGSSWPSVSLTSMQHDTSNIQMPFTKEHKANSSAASSELPPSSRASSKQPLQTPEDTASKVESNNCCPECGYRPKGDPRWFGGSMAKHMKLQHATTPPAIYKCPFPGCTSQFKKRPDNLRQHQIEKNHFVDGQPGSSKRGGKRKKGDDQNEEA